VEVDGSDFLFKRFCCWKICYLVTLISQEFQLQKLFLLNAFIVELVASHLEVYLCFYLFVYLLVKVNVQFCVHI
jgi:hypothetical protein